MRWGVPPGFRSPCLRSVELWRLGYGSLLQSGRLHELLGVVLLAIAVNLIEFVCSALIPCSQHSLLYLQMSLLHAE
jgi:hypothetical protein